MGAIQDAFDDIIFKTYGNSRVVEQDFLIEYVQQMKDASYDVNMITMGQNGTGKSYAMHDIIHRAGGIKTENMIFPYHDTTYFIDRITKSHGENIWCDELTAFFPYRTSGSKEQTALFSAIEIARENRNWIIGCCRDARRINNNYRNGKCSIILWMMDHTDDPPSSEGAILLGQPYLEIEDRFYLNTIPPTFDLDVLKGEIQKLPSFLGWMFFDDITKTVPAETLAAYHREKTKGIEVYSDVKKAELKRKAGRLRVERSPGEEPL